MAALTRPQDVVVGDGWLVARYHRVHCTYVSPDMGESGFYGLTERLAFDIDERPSGRRLGVLYYAPENAAMDSPRRRHLAKILKEREAKLRDTTAAYALATSSAFIRGVLTTLSWMAPPGYPQKVVSSPKEGLDFIADHLPRIDAADLSESFEALLQDRLRIAS